MTQKSKAGVTEVPTYLIPGVWFWRWSCQRWWWWWCWRQRGAVGWEGWLWWWAYVQVERQQGGAEALLWCGTHPGLGPVLGHSCWPQGQARLERRWQCWQHSPGGEGEDGDRVDGTWHLARRWESVMVTGEEMAVEGEGRFLREPFCLTTLPFSPWLDLFVFWMPWNLCGFCWTVQTVRLWSASGVGIRGSWPSMAGVQALALVRWWWPPLLWARGSPLASLSAMVLTRQAWQQHRHSAEKQRKERSLCSINPQVKRADLDIQK